MNIVNDSLHTILQNDSDTYLEKKEYQDYRKLNTKPPYYDFWHNLILT